MKITPEVWGTSIGVIITQSNNILNKSVQLCFNPESAAKNGGIETVISMVEELETALKEFKLRLEKTLPEQGQSPWRTSDYDH